MTGTAGAVHVGLFDASGILRAKRLSSAAFDRIVASGWKFIDAAQWWAPDDTTWAVFGARGSSVVVDTSTARRYPFEDTVLYLADFTGPMAELSPRRVLGRAVDRAAAAGVVATAGWEFECFVLDADRTQQPATSRCWSALALAEEAEEIAALVGCLTGGDIDVDHICPEIGPGCLEIALGPEPALRSADSAALAKLYTKAFFASRAKRATFMAQMERDVPGLGGHPSLSLHNLTDGAPLLLDSPGRLSKIGASAVAGVLRLLPDLMPLVAPWPNSYRRYGAGNWAPSAPTWGVDNYSCAIRVVADDPDSARLEFRLPGADTMPHVCLGMLLGAAVWGIEAGLEPEAPVTPPADGRAGSDRRLPRDLEEAVQRMEESVVARELFGDAFVDHFAAARLAEVTACHRMVSQHERDRYLDVV